MPLGDRLRQQRHHRHLSQKALAEALGVSVHSVSRWERDEAVPQAHYRLQLSRYFQIPPQELFPDLDSQDQSPVSHPPLWNVPYARNPYFTGREAVLTSLYERLHAPASTDATPPLALTGPGGIGKTQTVLEYAYRYAQHYQAVFWIASETAATMMTSVVTFALLLHLPEQQEADDVALERAVKRWLHTHTGWLLIWDDLADLMQLSHFDGAGANGQMLLTTQQQFTGTWAVHIDLSLLPEEEGTTFLLHRAKRLARDQDLSAIAAPILRQARRIYQQLEGLPLALDQAGAYMEESGCSLSDYLQRYEHTRLHLLQRRGYSTQAHPLSVAATFCLAFEQVERLSLLALHILRLCAFMYPQDIPKALIEAALPFLSEDAPPGENLLRLDEALVVLRSLSLILPHPGAQTFCVLGLVQVVLRESLDPSQQRLWVHRLICALDAAFPQDASGAAYECYIPHIQQAHVLIEQQALLIPEAAQLLEKGGRYLLRRGRHAEAKPLLAHALTVRQALSGSDAVTSARIREQKAVLFDQEEGTG